MKNLSDSDYLKSEYKKINKLFLLRKFDLVIEKTKKILKKNSTQIPFYNLLALSYRETGNLFLSEKTLIDALKIKPNDQSLLVNLGSVYRVLIEYKKSEKYLLQALSINPENINAIVNYANLKRDTNNYNESIQMYEKAYKMDDKNPIILINLSGIYQIVGKFSQSQKLLEKLLSQEKKNALAHKMLSTIKKYEIKDNHQTEMLLILKENLLSDYDKATLCFAISKSYEDQKNYKKSFEFFKQANDIQKKIHRKYSINDEANLFSKIKNIFKITNLEKYPNYLNDKKLIFIVGLPRSGTTLAHQILAAHSKIHGAGEMVILDQFMKKNINNDKFISMFYEYQSENNKFLEDIIKKYFSKISFIKTSKNIILDKNPLNFQWLGFIKVLFPNSKIIHCTRDLKDTALSIYKNAFDINSIVWSNNQDDLVKYIILYLDLMKFWETKFPNFIYNLSYEKLIENNKQEINNILNFCELNFENDCLNFNQKANPIKTVSVTQARKPIYKTSLNSFEKYKNYLDMFNEIKELEKNTYK
tara:strand:- start:2328 stop:3920 length:1593 start_codon:yes stop_codon:yes gene_type:complete